MTEIVASALPSNDTLLSRYIVVEPVNPAYPDGEWNVYFAIEQHSFCLLREPAESREHAEWFAEMFAVALRKVIAVEACEMLTVHRR